jgi:hypothetical protein
MFVYTSSLPPHDTRVKAELILPLKTRATDGPRMTAKARTLRVEPAAPGRSDGGFAAVFSRPIAFARNKKVS